MNHKKEHSKLEHIIEDNKSNLIISDLLDIFKEERSDQNIDGGTASSVYLPVQKIDGGNA